MEASDIDVATAPGRKRRWPVISAVVAVVLAVLYGGVSWVFSSKLIASTFQSLDPDLSHIDLPAPEDVPIQGDGVTLAASFYANPRKEQCAVVMLHGFGGKKTDVLGASPVFWDKGCDILIYDSRGHGDSSPALLTFGAHERKDLEKAIDWLTNKTGLSRSEVALIGWSYGAATAIQAAADVNNLAFVVSDSSFSSIRDIATVQAVKQFGAWAKIFVPGALWISGLRAGFEPKSAAPDEAIRRVQSPVLLIHSRQDEFTPVEHSEEVYANSDKSRTELVIPDWLATHGHSYTENKAGYTAAVDQFLARYAPTFGGTRK